MERKKRRERNKYINQFKKERRGMRVNKLEKKKKRDVEREEKRRNREDKNMNSFNL
jgi:hypothetical protein